MAWQVRLDSEFEKSLRKLDRQVARRILVKIYSLAELDEPQDRCKALSGPLTGLWRLRVGDYRVLLDIRRGEMVIVALDAGHRREIYDA